MSIQIKSSIFFSETFSRFDYRHFKGVKAKIIRYISRLWQIATERTSNFYLHPTFIYRFTKLYAEEKKMCNFLFDQTPKVLQYNNGSHRTFATDSKDSINFIDRLLEMEQRNLVDRKRVLEQINSFIVAVSSNGALPRM